MHSKLSRLISAVVVITVISLGWPALHAQQSATESLAQRVEALRAMEQDARRAALAQMSADERSALWFELKRSQAAENGHTLSKTTASSPYRAARGADEAGPARNVAPPQRLVGTIVYDQNNPDITFGGGAIIGNRFDTAVGDPVLTSGSVSSVVAVVQQGPAFGTMDDSAGFVLEGPQTVGGGAMALFSTFTNGLTATTETVTYTGIGAVYPGASFFVLFGDFASSYVPAFSSGTTQGQGHHGVVGYTGGMGPNITSTFNFGDTLNALIRVTGNVLPVELMSFDVE